MARDNKEYVLVHGAAHGAWCWEDVTRRLQEKGHHVVTLDLPGHGRRVADARHASVDAYARAVVDAMALEAVSRGIVVGHSMGGVVIQKVAELAPSRIAHLVFLAALVLPDGSSVADIHLSPSVRDAMHAMALGRGDGRFLFPAGMAWDRWMSDLPREHPAVRQALASLTPQPLRPFHEKLTLDRFYASRLPRTYIRCLRDAAVPPPKAAEYARRLGVVPIDLDAAHDPMLSQPGALARILERI